MFIIINVINSFLTLSSSRGNEFYTKYNTFNYSTNDTISPIPYIIMSLKEVKLIAPKIPYELRGDTMTYDVNKYKSLETVKLEDVLKKIEGFSVDPNGKISFLGKEIKKIYLDGDDIAGNQYTLLSKFVQANSVSKIQLINNFNENRLIKEINSSSDIALNLRMTDDVKNRVNSTIKADYSINNYGAVDASQLSVYKKFKGVSYATTNNIGKEKVNQNNNQLISSGDIRLSENEFNLINDFIQNGKIIPPNLKYTYTLFNYDKQLSTCFTLKPTKNSHLRIAGSGSNLKLSLQDFSNLTIQSIQDSWQFDSNIKTKEHSKLSDYTIEYKVDNNRNRIFTYKFYLKRIHAMNDYFEKRMTNLFDTLNQKMILVDSDYFISLNETFKIRKTHILNIEYNAEMRTIGNNTYVSTTLPEKLIFSKVIRSSHRQRYENRINTDYFNVYLLSRSKLANLRYGLNLYKFYSNSINRIYNSMNEVDTLLINSPYRYEIIKSSFYSNLSLQKFKYFTYTLYSSIGYSNSFISHRIKSSSLLYNYQMSLSYKRKPLSIFSFEIEAKNSIADLYTNFSYPLLSGISSTLFGSENMSLHKIVHFMTNYNYTNLYRAFSFSYSISGIYSSGDNILSSNLNPNNTILTFFKNTGTNHLSVFCKMDKYVQPIKLKITYTFQFTNLKIPNLIDGVLDKPSMYNTMNTIGLTSAWDSKIQIESNFHLSNSSYHSKYLNSIIDKSMSNIEIGYKVNYHFYKNAMIVIQSKNIKNRLQSSFNLLDGIIQFKNKKNILFTLTLHNLLKENIFRERIIFQNSIIERKFNIVPRYIMFGINYSF